MPPIGPNPPRNGEWAKDPSMYLWTACGGKKQGVQRFPCTEENAYVWHRGTWVGFGSPGLLTRLGDDVVTRNIAAMVGKFRGLTAATDVHPHGNGANVEDILVFRVHEEVELERDEQGIQLGGTWTSEYLNLVRERLGQFEPFAPACTGKPPPLNLLFVGAGDSGCSTALNTLVSALRQDASNVFAARGSRTVRQQTVDLTRLGVPGVSVTDICGWVQDDDEWAAFVRLLRCVVLGKTRHNDLLLPLCPDALVAMEESAAAPFPRRMHCIVVARPCDLVPQEARSYDERVRELRRVFRHTAEVVVILSKCDRTLSDEPLEIVYVRDAVLWVREEVARRTQLELGNILPVVGYAGTTACPHTVVDLMALRALKMCLVAAQFTLNEFCNREQRQQQQRPNRHGGGGGGVQPPNGARENGGPRMVPPMCDDTLDDAA
eukprot:TRINITY_DN9493_c0_g1_i1.p1 TRINITY_DN9493_c0_g1~~TRINITY_DN9493_c0_g1_i1.p1  ORF type:complete len:479 (-),score=87.72 TRINITY_DN9493_c0_g1_i1:7-1308(-)